MTKDNKGWSSLSRHERGYGTAWVKTRERILKRDCGICQPCMRRGLVHAGTEVDHVVNKAAATKHGMTPEQLESDDNLQVICSEAHKIKTAAERGKSIKIRKKIGVDGFEL